MKVQTLHSKSLAQVYEDFGRKIPASGIHDMGWVNGWGQGTYAFTRALGDYIVPGTWSSETTPRGRGRTEYVVSDGTDTVFVRYQVDSGD